MSGAPDRSVWRVLGEPLLPGGAEGPLAGESVAVKDVFAVAGHRIGAGIPAWLEGAAVEPASAPSLQRLVDAGASVRGIAQTDQLAYSLAGDNPHYGTPPNPRVPGALSGGSSSGPATAVASGAASIGLATDTAGSVRVPASYQGLWGLRTTRGSVPAAGVLPLAEEFDTVGLLTADSGVLARAAEVLTVGAPRTGLDGPRLLVADWPGLAQPVASAFARWCAGLGPLVQLELGDLGEAAEAFRVHQAWQAWANHGDWVSSHPGAVLGAAAERFAVASRIDAGEAERARRRTGEWRAHLDALLGDDVLVLPSAPSPAPRLDAGGAEVDRLRAATMRLTCVAGLTGRPAVAAPCLETAGGPVGVCLVGPRGSDLALIELATTLAPHPR